MTLENWAQHRSGQAVREIISPAGPTPDRTSHRTEHRLPELVASGRPTQWHQYNILTGNLSKAIHILLDLISSGLTAQPVNSCT